MDLAFVEEIRGCVLFQFVFVVYGERIFPNLTVD